MRRMGHPKFKTGKTPGHPPTEAGADKFIVTLARRE
jgi:hypothetical protein